MKKIILLFVAISVSNILLAQTENYTIAVAHFQNNYNTEDFESIFNGFSNQMQQLLPLEKTKQFFKSLLNGAGKIEASEFVGNGDGSTAIYKAKFERATFKIYISLDEQNKIGGLLIKPYVDESSTGKHIVNALHSYPKEIAETIFSKTTDFPDNTQLSIAIIENGEAKYYGIIKQNDSIKTIQNQNKIFEIGSITKVFTSTVLASLVLENKIKLTDAINSYYPFKFRNDIALSFESLANHASGLPRLPDNLGSDNTDNPYKKFGKHEIEEYLQKHLKLESNSVKTYSYSNLGAGLLGYTLGLTQKTSFQDLLQKEVFDKYSMTNSYASIKNRNEALVKGLDENGNEVSNWDFDVLFGGGGILSTTENLVKFATAQFDPQNKALTLTRTSTFSISDQMEIGLAWHILKSANKNNLFWHNGGTGGYSSSMIVDPQNKFAVIILSNVSAFNQKMTNIDELGFELTRKLNKH